ncbi:TonB-dependent receptor plug domain-containing protein [uncultured Fibrobacter sp.]|uniref:TonB-dependent receptor plug domain-containing protein n=1 Tax=uncultured Fibrobacter sp. TaxID=261512 RepID=UPI0025DAB87E|nr:TonB-dependent receptor plug domain-containing protein [uncultured Fibrobacter sp.]
MKKMFIYKAIAFAAIFATLGVVPARAQDDEVTSIDDFLEESAPESATADGNTNSAVAQSGTSVDNASGITQLDELSVESEVEAEQAKQAKKAEAVVTIDAAEMQNTSKTVSKAINSASGVKVRKSGGMGSEGKVNIRGMEGKNIKVLVNGVPVETQGNLGLDDIPIDQIADIEVYKGYVPARFATDGAGGAINIITKKRPANSVDASYSFSSFNTHKASVAASHLIDSIAGGAGLEVGVSGYFNHSDNDYEFTSPYMKSSTGKDTSIVRDHDHYTSYNVQAFANLMNAWFDQVSLGASYGAFDKEIQGDANRIVETKNEGYNFGATFGLDKKNIFVNDLNFGNHFSFGYSENKVIDTSRVHCRNWFTCDTAKKNVGELSTMGLPKLRTVQAHDINDLLNLDYQFIRNQFIYWNTLFRYHKEDPEDDFGTKMLGFNTAGYPGKTVSVTTGLSLEDNFFDSRLQNLLGFKFHYLKADISNTSTSRLQKATVESNDYTDFGYDECLMFRIVKPLAVKGSYQHAVRLPTPDELFGDGVRVSAATNLKPEEADNFNVGLSLDLQEIPLVARFRFDGDVFYSYYKNRIHYMGSSQMSVPYFNMDPIRGWGYEGDVKLDVNEWILLGTNWTFQDLRNIDYNAKQGILEDAIIPNIPRFFMNYLAEFHMGDVINKNDFLKFWWSANYTDEYYYGWKISSRQSRKIEASFTQDLGIEYSVWDNKLAWSFEVDNFMDEIVYDKYGESKPGRTFATKIRYSFR